jgi:hypothetical protein
MNFVTQVILHSETSNLTARANLMPLLTCSFSNYSWWSRIGRINLYFLFCLAIYEDTFDVGTLVCPTVITFR